MTKGIILYQSKYGTTKKYANWLTEETNFDCVETKKARLSQLKPYNTIILGGGIYASGILGFSFLKKNIDQLLDKKIAVFCVGASPYNEAAFQQMYSHNFTKNLSGIRCFYCRGAWDENKMSFQDRMLCKMLQKAVAKKDPSTYEPWEAALMCSVGKQCDWSDKEYLKPIIEYINA
jgi:menaquinone-dependent protoporphyrinogen IX oxidase